MPLVQDADQLKRDVATIRKLLKENGRPENAAQISPLVEPKGDGPTTDELKWLRDAGADRIILLSQQTVADTANGKALELIKRFSGVVERNRAI